MYKIKDESEHHYEIETPEGHSFHVAKEGLSKHMHENIRKLYDGGKMAHYEEGTLDAEPTDIEAPAPEVPSAPVAPVPQETPAVAPAVTTPEAAAQLENAIRNEREALNTQEQVASRAAEEESGLLKHAVKDAQSELVEHQAREIERNQQQDELAKQIVESKIDPKAYFHNLSTPGKISTIIGLVLGGIGAGGSGGGVNQGVEVLNQQIKNDVDAQKANLENKNSLYMKNLERTRDEREATILTQSQQLSIAKMQLAQAAARNQGPQAMVANQFAQAALDRQQALLSQQLMVTRLQNKIATGGAFPAELAPLATNPASVVSLGNGTAIQASSPQAAAKVSEVLGQHQPPIDTLNKLEELSVNPIRPNSPEYQRAQSLVGTLLTQLKSATGLGRLSPEAMKILEKTYNDPTHIRDLFLKDEKTKALKQSLIEQRDAKIAPYLPSYRPRTSLGFKPGLHGKRD